MFSLVLCMKYVSSYGSRLIAAIENDCLIGPAICTLHHRVCFGHVYVVATVSLAIVHIHHRCTKA